MFYLIGRPKEKKGDFNEDSWTPVIILHVSTLFVALFRKASCLN